MPIAVEAEGEGLGSHLPVGPARAEAVLALVRQEGRPVEEVEPVLHSAGEAERLCRERGRHSIELLRVDATLLPELQIGRWFDANSRTRCVRRALWRTPRLASILRRLVRTPATVRLSTDVWFWAGVRSAATRAEWERLTRSSYAVLCYHRLAGRPGDWDDVSPARLARQLRLLRRLGFASLSADEALRFHTDPGATLRRRFMVTADDGYVDALDTLAAHRELHPLAFVVAGVASGDVSAGWRVEERGASFAGWDGVRRAAAAGVDIASHTRSHPRLTTCDDDTLKSELADVRAELEAADVGAKPIVAYPFGDADARVRAAARRAGYVLGYTIDGGANGAGSDPFALGRVMVRAGDSLLTIAWIALTGEARPAPLQRLRRRRSTR